MSQSRFSIVLVGVSALLRRPLVSRLRPADGDRSRLRWFSPLGATFRFGDYRWAGWPSGSLLPLFGTHRFGDSARRVGLRAHCFRFSACTVSEIALGELALPPSASEIALGGLVLPLGELAFGLTASAFRHAPFRRLPLSGLAFGLTASAFRHAPFRSCRSAGWFFRLPLRRLPFGGLAFGLPLRGLPPGELVFGLTASAFRHAPLRSGRWASSFFRLPLRKLPLAG